MSNENTTPKSGWLERLVNRPYSDWFGKGDTKQDVAEIIKEYGDPEEVLCEDGGYMACVIYADKVIVVGYDGNEYTHSFEFPRAKAANISNSTTSTGSTKL